jgi:O-antigen ligase
MPMLAVLIDGIGGHDVARIAQLALGLICALVLLAANRAERGARMAIPVLAASGLVLLLALMSTLRAPDLAMATRELAIFAGLVAIALVVARIRDTVLVPSVAASAASAAYVAVVLILIVMTYLVGQRPIRVELFIGYDNYRFFNHVQTAALPLAILAVTVAPRRTWLRGVAWFAAIGGFALLFTIAGRGTMVGIAVGAVAVGVIFGRVSFATLRNLAIAAALGLVLFMMLFFFLPLLTGATPGLSEGHYDSRLGSVEVRFFLWRIAQSYIEQAPWLGIGPMHYAHFPTGDAAHPHNIYLQIAAEWGMPMLVLVIAVGALTLRRLVVAVRQCTETRERDCGIGLFLACAAIAVDGLFSGNFVMPVSQVWIAFTFGWAMAWLAGQDRNELAKPSQGVGGISMKRIAIFGLLVSQIWLGWNVWPEVIHLDEHVRRTMDRVPTAVMNPRFWSHGWF